jgi:Diguanylate cyclase, GGDEF domain
VIVGDSTAFGAQNFAHRVVEAVRAAAISTTPGNHLTFSIGVATYPDDALTAVELVSAADQALYLAKREGKDRACTFPQLVTELELDDVSLFTMMAEAGPQMVVAVARMRSITGAQSPRATRAVSPPSPTRPVAERASRRAGWRTCGRPPSSMTSAT